MSFCSLLHRSPFPDWKEGGRGASSFSPRNFFLVSLLLTHGSGGAVRNRTLQYPKKVLKSISLPKARNCPQRAPHVPDPLQSFAAGAHLNTSLPLYVCSGFCFLDVPTQTVLLIFDKKRCGDKTRVDRLLKAVIK